MLVDMTLPRRIPAETALRMVRKVVQTLMYLRGQMATSWDQLEVLLMQENMRQEQEQELEQGSQSHKDSFHHDPHLGTRNHAQDEDDDNENDFVIPTKSLREFLETGERMFVDLEESVYGQLYSDLRHSSTPTSANTSTPPPRYLSLALIFGTTFTTPKEQYMLRIGPLEPRLPSPSSSTPSSAYIHNPHPTNLPAPLPATTEISPKEQANRTREEKKWDRLLIQNLMGILPFPPPSDQYPSSDHNQQQQEGYGSLLGTDPLRHRTKTHLLMRAPAGKIFTGMFPQQHLLLHQDYPTPSRSRSPSQIDKDGQVEEVPATQSCWNQGCRNHKKPARWPIHHIHIFGPSSDQDTDNQGMNGDVDEDEDEMWYLIGPGIPLLSPLL
ncbi:hypothetical protein KI688_007739 [Linnemannia hyalina]|uniref:Uncharacterized protein n=1 Tax=Linnemannia hyalina TaxID=64524 RepID=A0A9P7XGQ1_9FUNG|nr:hypothetical protein KI688_007739 [Linnemannia hyalina]